jgi:hypothetical protein
LPGVTSTHPLTRDGPTNGVRSAVLFLALAFLLGAVLPGSMPETRQVLGSSVDHQQRTEAVSFNLQSLQSLQPSRSSVRTRLATCLQNAIGINFNVTAQGRKQQPACCARAVFAERGSSFRGPL